MTDTPLLRQSNTHSQEGEPNNGSPSTQAQTKTVAEYFAGIGLVRLGLEQAGWQVEFANDFDPQKQEMYAAYFNEAPGHYIVEDVFKLDTETIPRTLLATSSFPCIDLSLAGNLNGMVNGKHSSAIWGFLRVLKQQGEHRPPIIMLENVPGWLTSNKGQDFRITIEALNELGYACDVFNLDALRFTPQSRLRIFVVGMQVDKPNRRFGEFLDRPPSLASAQLKKAVDANQDLVWHFLKIPTPPPAKVDGLASIIEELEEGDERWWSEEEVRRHLAMMAPSHLKRVQELAAQPQYSYRTVYRRRRQGAQRAEVREGDTAGCLRTARGGSSRQIVVMAGHGHIRMRHMTPREYARLQGVPDAYPVPKNVIQALTGFGDAVCVPAIKWIGVNVLNPLASIFSNRVD
jgi:DNA (cytosine-5)-methyltransferase 1